jgi:probable F420-dependent oxidoreductase
MSADIDLGVMLPTFGQGANPEAFGRFADQAEDGDFDAIWVGDHITFPEEIPDTYPFSPDGNSPFDIGQDAYELFQVLTFLAARTETVDVGSNTCIVPYRHPAVLARNALTIEALSNGRFDFGVAPGWMRTEFEVLDVPFEERGSRTDEFLQMFERLREDGELAFDGPHHSFQKTGFHPVPDGDRPKIWVGGKSGAAFRRVAEFGDGWTIFWDRPDEIRDARDRIMNAWTDYERSGTPEIAVIRAVDVDENSDYDTSRPFVGSAASICEDIEHYQDAGVTKVIFDFYDRSTGGQMEQMERLADSVLPNV